MYIYYQQKYDRPVPYIYYHQIYIYTYIYIYIYMYYIIYIHQLYHPSCIHHQVMGSCGNAS